MCVPVQVRILPFFKKRPKVNGKEKAFFPFLTRGKHRCLLALKDGVCVWRRGPAIINIPRLDGTGASLHLYHGTRYLELTSDLSVGLSFSLFNGRQWTISGRVVS